MKRTYTIKPTYSICWVGRGKKTHVRRDGEWGALCGAYNRNLSITPHAIHKNMAAGPCYRVFEGDVLDTCKVCSRRLGHIVRTDTSSIQPPV